VIGSVQHVEPARIGRIGVIDRPVFESEDADARRLFAVGLDRAEIVDEPLLVRLEGCAVIEIEVAAGRRHPAEGPAHALLIGLELGERRARDHDE